MIAIAAPADGLSWEIVVRNGMAAGKSPGRPNPGWFAYPTSTGEVWFYDGKEYVACYTFTEGTSVWSGEPALRAMPRLIADQLPPRLRKLRDAAGRP